MNRILAGLTRWCAIAVTAFALGAGVQPSGAQAPALVRPRVAVLPLDNNSRDAKQSFFAEGITDEIAVALTAVRGLDVVARSSSFQLKPAERDVKSAGRALNASHLVQGSARMGNGLAAVGMAAALIATFFRPAGIETTNLMWLIAALAIGISAVGAYGWNQQKPVSSYAAIAHALVAEGWRPHDSVAVFGSFYDYRSPLERYLPHAPAFARA